MDIEQRWSSIAQNLIKGKSMRTFKAHFGMHPRVINVVWEKIKNIDLVPEHLLWWLYYTKINPTLDQAEIFLQKSAKTILKYRKSISLALKNLDYVCDY